jgi:DNA-binding CsgD family transcriptional regulator/tetratricopeptide (TPR) repeat protein
MLIERDEYIADLQKHLDAARSGHGQLVFLGGEAGVGKTTLIAAFADTIPADVVVRRGACDNITTAAALGSMVEAVPEIADELIDGSAVPRLRLFRRIRDLLAESPTVLLLEDVHWADEATLELLRFLGRRINDIPVLVVCTFRVDEVGPEHGLTLVLGDLATSRATTQVSLPPLSAAGVRQLVEQSGSVLDAAELHDRTGGNPFYVTEVLASESTTVPSTVRDAVVARTSQLSPAARTVLSTVAVLGHRPEIDRVVAVSQESLDAVDECLRSGVLVGEGDRVAFRHELARLAVLQSIPRAVSSDLHARALSELQERSSRDHRRMSYHAVGSRNRPAIAEHTPLAAEHAARLGAHREAAEHYRAALRWADDDDSNRAAWLERLSYECYLTDALDEALACRREVLDLHERAGDSLASGDTERWMSRLLWFLGRNAESAAYAARAVDVLQPLGDSKQLAMAYSNMSQLRMLAADSPGAIDWAERAIALAEQLDDRDTRIHALNNLGTAMALTNEALEGTTRIMQSLELALADDAEEHAARAYTNLGSTRVMRRALVEADSSLRDGISYCTEHDLDSWRLYMTAWLARCTAELGRIVEAQQHAANVIQSPRVSPVALIPALIVSGEMSNWRGEDGHERLDQALELAAVTGETQRLVPVASARAEAAWIAGRTSEIVEAIDLAWDAAVTYPTAWELGELAWWLHVAGVQRETPIPVAQPFALLIEDDHVAAAREWKALACPVWTARALIMSDDVEDAREAVRILDDIGAVAVRDALLRDRHARGQAVPRGPRSTSKANPAGLTVRESEVLELLADGLSNADIAGRLFLSEKTVGHHVSAVLRKLDEPTRSRAVATARTRGLIAN